ncbi:MAG TPA: Clp protease N-terminal domain-containing protein, partial [Thermomicrobiales bacterium]|nr:Clp protease N-terminal domain-containing protein [Thermomicrobiales bacterium]
MASQQRFTERAQEAILEAQQRTRADSLSQFEPETLLLTLLHQPEGIVPTLIQKAEIDLPELQAAMAAAVAGLPKLQISADAVVSAQMRKLLDAAQREASQMGDEYISTEHLLLGTYATSGNAL